MLLYNYFGLFLFPQIFWGGFKAFNRLKGGFKWELELNFWTKYNVWEKILKVFPHPIPPLNLQFSKIFISKIASLVNRENGM